MRTIENQKSERGKTVNYYNEIDPYASQWLRVLMSADLIPHGDVDARPIQEVMPSDLSDYSQCHFFAGIGGWSLALQLAGWPTDRPVWTGSCPCQPFSTAGKNEGDKDARHLWPEFYRLIKESKPDTVFGERVTGAIKHGWLDGVSADLEAEDYAVGSAVLGAHGVGAPHTRQRLWWVADHNGKARRIKPGLEPLVARIPGHGAQLRAIGNSIVQQIAAEFIKAYMELLND